MREKGFYDKALALEALIEEVLNDRKKCMLIKKNQNIIEEKPSNFTEPLALLNVLVECSDYTSTSFKIIKYMSLF